MARKSAYQGPGAALVHYENLIATIDNVERRGATMPYTSCHGHMFSFLDPAGSMALRLPQSVREDFLKTHESVLAEQHGRVMKEYVVVPDWLLQHTAELRPWFDRSHAYVSGLTPKPAARD